jgi:hypothetical protein
MKKAIKKTKKLKTSDFKMMWGGDGPYSQVNIIEQSRVLDTAVSRIFLVVEAEINPFTFEYVEDHIEQFAQDIPVLQLIEHAEYRGEFGYIVSAGEVESTKKGARAFAETQRQMTLDTIIRMHTFVIDQFNLEVPEKVDVVEVAGMSDKRFIWDDELGMVEDGVVNSLFENQVLVGSESGTKNNKMRFYFILAFTAPSSTFAEKSIMLFIKTLQKISRDYGVEVEDSEVFMDYMALTLNVEHGVPPALIIEKLTEEVNTKNKKPIFKTTYMVTNTGEPTQVEIMQFMRSLEKK